MIISKVIFMVSINAINCQNGPFWQFMAFMNPNNYDFGYNHVGYHWIKHGKCGPSVKTRGQNLDWIKSYGQKIKT